MIRVKDETEDLNKYKICFNVSRLPALIHPGVLQMSLVAFLDLFEGVIADFTFLMKLSKISPENMGEASTRVK